MEIRQLRYFVTAAETLNFTRAAERLRVAQPALSRQIRSLESELDVTLFERDSRRVVLTEAGKALLEDASEILELVEAAEARVKRCNSDAPTPVTIGYGPSLVGNHMWRIVRQLSSSSANLKVELRDLSNGEMIEGIRDREIDFGVLPAPAIPSSDHFVVKSLRPIRFDVALPVGHPLAENEKLSVSDLAHENLIAYDRKLYPDYWEVLKEAYEKAKRPLIVSSEVDGGTTLATSIQSGQGVALVTSSFNAEAIEKVPLSPSVDIFNLALLHHRDLPQKIVDTVEDIFVKELSEDR